jgi:hypothetical protein
MRLPEKRRVLGWNPAEEKKYFLISDIGMDSDVNIRTLLISELF